MINKDQIDFLLAEGCLIENLQVLVSLRSSRIHAPLNSLAVERCQYHISFLERCYNRHSIYQSWRWKEDV